MKPHQREVIEERDTLNERIASLAAFTFSAEFGNCPTSERALLRQQLEAMRRYAYVLTLRIDQFKP